MVARVEREESLSFLRCGYIGEGFLGATVCAIVSMAVPMAFDQRHGDSAHGCLDKVCVACSM